MFLYTDLSEERPFADSQKKEELITFVLSKYVFYNMTITICLEKRYLEIFFDLF